MILSANTNISVTIDVKQIWFGTKPLTGSLDDIQTYNIYYDIDQTSPTTQPVFKQLMEYNKVSDTEYVVPTEVPTSIDTYGNGYIGEYFRSSDYSITKIFYPRKLVQLGYVYAAVFSTRISELDIPYSEFSNYYYQIIANDGNPSMTAGIDYKCDSIIQLFSINGNYDDQFITIHTSNYNNPHYHQISKLTSSYDIHKIANKSTIQSGLEVPNAITVGNQLMAEDYSLHYIGDRILL